MENSARLCMLSAQSALDLDTCLDRVGSRVIIQRNAGEGIQGKNTGGERVVNQGTYPALPYPKNRRKGQPSSAKCRNNAT